jgi:hypothetical protein
VWCKCSMSETGAESSEMVKYPWWLQQLPQNMKDGCEHDVILENWTVEAADGRSLILQ